MPHKNPLHIPLRDIPPQGKRYEVNETHVWEDPLQEFRMDCRLVSAPCMQLTILPTDEGWLLRGRIGAKVVVPCCRCAKGKTSSQFNCSPVPGDGASSTAHRSRPVRKSFSAKGKSGSTCR